MKYISTLNQFYSKLVNNMLYLCVSPWVTFDEQDTSKPPLWQSFVVKGIIFLELPELVLETIFCILIATAVLAFAAVSTVVTYPVAFLIELLFS